MALNVAQRHRDEQLLEAKDGAAEHFDEDVDSDEKIARVTSEIEELQKQMRDVTGTIGAQPTGKTEFFKKKAELQQRLDECSRRVDACLELQQQAGRKAELQQRSDAQRRPAPPTHAVSAEVQEQVRTIEHRMLTESLTLRDEKRLLEEIARLKEEPRATRRSTGEDDTAPSDSGPAVKESQQKTTAQLAALRDEKRALQAEYAAFMAARKTQLAVVPRMHEQREALSQRLGAKIRERAALREVVRAADKQFGQQIVERAAARAEKARAERQDGIRERNDFRRQREAEKLEEKPCVLETALVEQTMKFCRSFLRTEVVKKEATSTKYDTPAGAVVLLSKDQRADDLYVAPVKRGKSGRPKASKSTSIKHNAETFKFFEKLNIDAPITTEDIPATLEKLEGLLQSYNRKVEEWEDKRLEIKKKKMEEERPPLAEDGRDRKPESGRGEASEGDSLRGEAEGADGGAE